MRALRHFGCCDNSPISDATVDWHEHPTNMNDFAPGADLDVVVLPDVLLRAFVRFSLRRADERTPDEG